MKSPFKRDVFWLCARHKFAVGDLGDAARRLMRADTVADCSTQDLNLLLAEAWKLSRLGFYLSSLRCQGAALRLQDMLKKGAA